MYVILLLCGKLIVHKFETIRHLWFTKFPIFRNIWFIRIDFMCFSNVVFLKIYSVFIMKIVFIFADYSYRKSIRTDTTIYNKRRETTAYFMVCLQWVFGPIDPCDVTRTCARVCHRLSFSLLWRNLDELRN